MPKFANKYDLYRKDYRRFSKLKTKPQYVILSKKTNYYSDIVNLLKYDSLYLEDNIFLVVPSIFNSPEILFLSKKYNFIKNLQSMGSVYLLNWQPVQKQLKIEDLVHELQQIVNFIWSSASKKIHLIGHCIGGNICIAAAAHQDFALHSLSLMTTPWDFCHFSSLKSIIKNYEFQRIINSKEVIPKIYIQIMFFLMYPSQYKKKINKYFDSNLQVQEIFMQVEDWLQSGISIPKSLYLQIIDEFCLQNISYNNKWQINGSVVDLKNINIPTCIIYAKEDQIVPLTSIVPLQKMIKTSTLIKVEGGHIGYLVSRSRSFQKKYNDWLKNILN